MPPRYVFNGTHRHSATMTEADMLSSTLPLSSSRNLSHSPSVCSLWNPILLPALSGEYQPTRLHGRSCIATSPVFFLMYHAPASCGVVPCQTGHSGVLNPTNQVGPPALTLFLIFCATRRIPLLSITWPRPPIAVTPAPFHESATCASLGQVYKASFRALRSPTVPRASLTALHPSHQPCLRLSYVRLFLRQSIA